MYIHQPMNGDAIKHTKQILLTWKFENVTQAWTPFKSTA